MNGCLCGKHYKQRVVELEAAVRQAVGEKKIVEMPPDGHCLFRAVLVAVRAVDPNSTDITSVTEMRRKCADMMKANRSFFDGFVCENLTFDMHLKNLTVVDTEVASVESWGGEAEILAMSLTFERPVVIFRSATDEVRLHCHAMVNAMAAPIALLYNGIHYDSIDVDGTIGTFIAQSGMPVSACAEDSRVLLTKALCSSKREVLTKKCEACNIRWTRRMNKKDLAAQVVLLFLLSLL